jgi:putative multiple sugar transport system substrate-binding protein
LTLRAETFCPLITIFKTGEDKMLKKRSLIVMLILLALTAVLVACGSGATEEPAIEAEPAATSETAAAVAGKVGIVLPTKDEPRWVQDETRFKEALAAAGYEVEILFSQGDSPKKRPTSKT